MLYRTEDPARWGVGKGSNLLPVEIDGNFWELAQRLVAVEASAGEAANGIANIGVVGSQMTVYLEDGTALGPYTLPVAMIRYRGDWTAAATYGELDLVTVPDVGVYLVLQDHTADAAFDALAADAEGNSLYRWLFPMGSVDASMAELTDVAITPTPPENGQSLVYDDGIWYAGFPEMGLGNLQGIFIGQAGFPGALADGDVLTWVAGDSAWRNRPPAPGVTTLDGLTDVTIAGPATGQFLRHDGAAFVNAVVDWSDLANKPGAFTPAVHTHAYDDLTGIPATFAPSAHQHPWGDLTGVPATFAPAAHTHPASEIDGAMDAAIYDPQGIAGDAFARGNFTGDHAFRAAQITNTAFASGAVTTILYAEVSDPSDAYDPATGVYTAQRSGVHLFSWGAWVPSQASSFSAYASIYVNGAEVARPTYLIDNLNRSSGTAIALALAAGDQVKITYWHNLGSTISSSLFATAGAIWYFAGAAI